MGTFVTYDPQLKRVVPDSWERIKVGKQGANQYLETKIQKELLND